MSKQNSARSLRPENRRQQLLDAAAKRFSDQGYANTSMRDIAKDVGMLAGSMYYHFTSKEELLLAIHEEGVRRFAQGIEQAISGKSDPWDRLEAAAIAHLSMLLDGGDHTQVVVREHPREDGPTRRRLTELRHEYESIFRRLVDDLDLPPGIERRYLRLMLMGAMNWSQSWFKPKGALEPAELARQFMNILRAIRPKE
jgi:AcrR family transcriptional regulator